jgi:hypothetical protein
MNNKKTILILTNSFTLVINELGMKIIERKGWPQFPENLSYMAKIDNSSFEYYYFKHQITKY